MDSRPAPHVRSPRDGATLLPSMSKECSVHTAPKSRAFKSLPYPNMMLDPSLLRKKKIRVRVYFPQIYWARYDAIHPIPACSYDLDLLFWSFLILSSWFHQQQCFYRNCLKQLVGKFSTTIFVGKAYRLQVFDRIDFMKIATRIYKKARW